MARTLFGLRMLAKKPVFTLVAALSLALGIGLNTAIFALIDTILLGSLSFREPDRVVAIWSVPPGHPEQLNSASILDYLCARRNGSGQCRDATMPRDNLAGSSRR